MRRSLLASLLGLTATLTTAQVDINIDLKERGIDISPTLYGIFYEDINHSADGGLYAELVRNRSFEEMTRGIQSWQTLGTASMELTQEGLLNDKQGNALLLTIAQGGDGVQNEGFWGMNIENGKQYRLSLWAKAVQGKSGTLTAKLVGQRGETLGETTIETAIGKRWQKLEATIVATGNDAKAHLELTAQKPCKLALDVVSLFPPTYKNRDNGMREQLAVMLEELSPRFVRFPGGCYVEGHTTPESAFRWERTVGPIEERPGHQGVNWGYWISDGVGFHEFLQLSEDLGAEPLYVVNVGIWHGGYTPLDSLDMWIDECLDALEYANGDAKTTKYGALRAKNGHAEPFNLKYLEIGNENANFHFDDNSDQSYQYFERYRRFYDAIKAKYPDMQCIGNVQSWGTDKPSWRSAEPVDILDEHYYRNPSWFMEAYDKYDTYDRQGPKIYVGEWAVTSQFGKVGNMNAALGEAVYMMGMENNSDIVIMNSYAPLFVNENAFNWPTDLIHYDSKRAFGTPSYWSQQLFANHIGNRLMKTELTWQLPEAEVKSIEGKPLQVGVSAWGTQATFKDAQLIVDGEVLAIDDITEWAAPMMPMRQRAPEGDMPEGVAPPEGAPRMFRTRQAWLTDRDEKTVTNAGWTEGRKWLCPTEFTAKKYSFSAKARKDRGNEGFILVYNYQNERDFDWLNIGGWGNTQNAIEQSVDGGRMTLTDDCEFSVKEGQWYDVRVDVEGDSVAAYVDGTLQFTARHKSGDMRGIFANSTLDEAAGTLYVKIVNVGGEQTVGTVNIANGRATKAEMTRLAGTSGQDENTIDTPLNIIPRPANVDISADGKRLSFDVAPWSVNVITVKVNE